MVNRAKHLITGVVILVVIVGGIFIIPKTTMWDRFTKDIKSNVTGLNRTVKIYTYNGELIAEYEGDDVLVDDGNGGTITVMVNGKRITLANVSVIIEEK